MRRHVLNVMVIVGTLWLGAVTISRGQIALGACLIGLAILRAGMLFAGRKPSKVEPEIRLDLTKPSALRYPKLPPDLRAQLDSITPSMDGDLKYFACLARLNDGTEVDPVLLVSEAPYLAHWGVYPGQDPGKAEIRLSDVASLSESRGPKSAPRCYCIYSE